MDDTPHLNPKIPGAADLRTTKGSACNALDEDNAASARHKHQIDVNLCSIRILRNTSFWDSNSRQVLYIHPCSADPAIIDAAITCPACQPLQDGGVCEELLACS